MRPKERRESGQTDLFRARLDQIVDPDHALVWSCFALVESVLLSIRPAFRTEPD